MLNKNVSYISLFFRELRQIRLFILIAIMTVFAIPQVTTADIDVLCGPEFWENIGGVGAPVWQRNPTWDIQGLTGTYIYPALGDLDNDGDYDLLITKNDNPIIAYENTGSTTNPNWTRKAEWDFYVPDMEEDKVMSTFLVDLDNDDKIDLMVAKHNTVRAYKNTGTDTSPEWTRETDWDIELTGDNNLMTSFADLDADGDYDALVRNWSSVVSAFENVGSDTCPVWQRKSAWDPPHVGTYDGKCLCDLDIDGDYDIIGGINQYTGQRRHTYENTGSQTEPIWTSRLDWELPDFYLNAYFAAVDIDADGPTGIENHESAQVPDRFVLFSPFPNPFSKYTVIRYGGIGFQSVEKQLTIYDLSGRLIREFPINNSRLTINEVSWDGKDKSGKKVASGIYFCRLEAGNYPATRKLTILR